MTMNTIGKSFLLLCVGISLLGASNSALANNKQWQDYAPKINVHTAGETDNYKLALSYDVKKSTKTSYHHDSSSLVIAVKHANMILDNIDVNKGYTLTVSRFKIQDKDGNVLPNCNMLENPAFVTGAANIDIAVSKNGCVVN